MSPASSHLSSFFPFSCNQTNTSMLNLIASAFATRDRILLAIMFIIELTTVTESYYPNRSRNKYEEELNAFVEEALHTWILMKELSKLRELLEECRKLLHTRDSLNWSFKKSMRAIDSTTTTHDPKSCNLDNFLMNAKHYKSNSVSHLALTAFRKQIQDMYLWFSHHYSNPPIMKSVFTALDMDLVLSPFHSILAMLDDDSTVLGIFNIAYKVEKSNDETYNVLGRSTRAIDNRIQLLDDDKYHEVHISFGAEPYHTSDFIKPIQSDGWLSLRKINHVILLIATMFAMLTFSVGLHPPNIISTRSESKEDYLSLTRSFILFNSVGFFISMAMIILLLQKYPLKPWPTFSVLALLVCYVFSTMAIFPNQSLDMLLLASSFALFATAWMFKMGL